LLRDIREKEENRRTATKAAEEQQGNLSREWYVPEETLEQQGDESQVNYSNNNYFDLTSLLSRFSLY
jgi:hypothetical protein